MPQQETAKLITLKTMAQVALEIGVPLGTVRKLARGGKLPYVMIGNQRMFDARAVAEHINGIALGRFVRYDGGASVDRSKAQLFEDTA